MVWPDRRHWQSWNPDFGQAGGDHRPRRDSTQAAALDASAARLALSGAPAQSYINLLLSYQQNDIALQTVTEREDILRLTQGRFNAGLESASAVEQAKALLALARVDVKHTAALRDLNVHAIAALTGQARLPMQPSRAQRPIWIPLYRCPRFCLPTCWRAVRMCWRRRHGWMLPPAYASRACGFLSQHQSHGPGGRRRSAFPIS